jgi:uncharacterized protein YehS (DUF1456 family)
MSEKKVKRNIIEPNRFREKQRKEYDKCGQDLTKMPKKKNSYWELKDDQVLCFMVCVTCKVAKERTTDHFTASHVNDDLEGWFNKYGAGCESLRNSTHYPCKKCTVIHHMNRITNDPIEFLKEFKFRYKNVNWDAMMKKWDDMEFGPITGIPKQYIVPSMGHPLAPGIHDIARLHLQAGEKYSSKHHTIDTVVFDLAVANVQQGKRINNLEQIYRDMYKHEIEYEYEHEQLADDDVCEEIQAWFDRTPIENGVTICRKDDQNGHTRECWKVHLKTILSGMVNNHRMDDKEAKRTRGNATKEVYLNVLLDHKMRCAISNMRLTIQKGLYTDVSMDRINNEISHDEGNLRPVSIVFQIGGKRQFSRKMFLHMCLVQKFHSVNDVARNRIQAEHDALQQDCPFCKVSEESLV